MNEHTKKKGEGRTYTIRPWFNSEDREREYILIRHLCFVRVVIRSIPRTNKLLLLRTWIKLTRFYWLKAISTFGREKRRRKSQYSRRISIINTFRTYVLSFFQKKKSWSVRKAALVYTYYYSSWHACLVNPFFPFTTTTYVRIHSSGKGVCLL